jgi:hypothetical protein
MTTAKPKRKVNESREILNKRNREHRKRMKEKGFKYLCVWVPQYLSEKIHNIIESWRHESKNEGE